MLFPIKEVKFPRFTIITPLKKIDEIPEETINNIISSVSSPFNWYSYSANNNVANNFDLGIKEVDKRGQLAEYVIKIDNDTLWNIHTLDYMCETLDDSEPYISYSYCGFEYYSAFNLKFPGIEFDERKMRNNNYISSNSMFKSSVIKKISLVTDDKYVRLLDWAYYLKLLKYGYYGKLSKGYFKARASKNSISSGSVDDFHKKRSLVMKDFL